MIAFIPARGGSKGLPGKNIKPLLGKPLIGRAIEEALASRYIDRVVVTTDDEEIASVAREYGAEVPFLRPQELATDTASAIDVYLHAAEFMRDQEGCDVEKFMVMLATAPMRTTEHIDEAVEKFNQDGARTLISMTEAETPVSWYHILDGQGRVHNAGFDAGNVVANRQANSTYYIPNGAIYILDYDLLKQERTYYCENTTIYEMSREDSIDIDTPYDFALAEYMMKLREEEHE